MPQISYMTVSGATQGNISSASNSADSMGNNYQTAHADEITVYKFDSHVRVPTDPLTGQPRGSRIHEAASVVVPFSKASPLLQTSLTKGELLQIAINFYRTSTAGSEEMFYTITYTDCILVSAKAYHAHAQNEEYEKYGPEEEFAFTYRKVEWNHGPASSSGSDDWRAAGS